jgi:hypothetical protein
MKEKICLKYQYTIFGDFSDIAPEKSEIIIKLMSLFARESFVPASFQELAFDQMPPIVANRIALTNKDGLCINIGNKRLDVEFNYLEDGIYSKMNLDEINSKAIDILSTLMIEFKKTCNRIALNIIKLLDDEKSKKISDAFYNTNTVIQYYNGNKPFEWNERFVSRVKGEKIGEEINIITGISKSEGTLATPKGEMKFDGIIVQFDINTLPGNVNYRFSQESLEGFLEDATKEIVLIENEIN